MSEVSFEPPNRRTHGKVRQPGLFATGALVLWIGLGCGGGQTDPAPATDPGAPRPTASGVATPPLKVGDPLPPLMAEGWLNGSAPTPDAPGVRLLVVDVWGDWCPYCAKSAPGLVRIHEKYSGRGVAFVSIAASQKDSVESYVRKHSIPWPNGHGASPQMIAALGAGSGMPGPADYEVAPTLYLVGPDGRVRWVDGRGRYRHQDARAWENAVDAAIAEALNTPAPKP